jgi:hypothetical protein
MCCQKESGLMQPKKGGFGGKALRRDDSKSVMATEIEKTFSGDEQLLSIGPTACLAFGQS